MPCRNSAPRPLRTVLPKLPPAPVALLFASAAIAVPTSSHPCTWRSVLRQRLPTPIACLKVQACIVLSKSVGYQWYQVSTPRYTLAAGPN